MTDKTKMVEQQMMEYASRMKHIDELLERATEGAANGPKDAETEAQLAKLWEDREKLSRMHHEMKLKSLDDWQEQEIEKSGPMGIWDAVAQQLEKLVEKVEK
jgi:hypothetical protein